MPNLRGVVPGGAGSAMAPPDFGRSVNPISTRGDRLCPPNYYCHPRVFRPSNGPVKVCKKAGLNVSPNYKTFPKWKQKLKLFFL